MSKDYTKELEKMQHLMNYGINESKNTDSSKGIIEYSQMGADGKTYGILREGTKYFVKVAPKKDTQILAEDYDYIGGFLNRKGYDSYTKASNALNLELIHVNESCGSKEPVKSQFKLNESAEWQNTETKEAKEDLNRFYQLCENIDNLLDKNVHYIREDKNAPYTDKGKKDADKGGGGNDGKMGSPDQGLGNGDKSFVKGEEKNAEQMQKKYEDGKVNDKTGFGDHNIGEDKGNPYQEDAKTSKEQGKSVNECKNKRVVKLSEDQKKQVLAWRNDRAFVHQSSDSELDRSHGTEIGDTAPYDNNVNENFETTEWDDGLPSSAGIGEPKKYKEPFENQKGVTQPVSENVLEFITNDEGDGLNSDFLPHVTDAEGGESDLSNFENLPDLDALDSDMIPGDNDAVDAQIYDRLGNGNDPLADLPSDDTNEPNSEVMGDGFDFENNPDLAPLYEAVKRITEDVLDDFGKHPAYQKKVMTLPKNADGSEWGEDWNDDSTKGEEPYGKKIGSSAPFDDVVSAITNAVVTALSSKKKE